MAWYPDAVKLVLQPEAREQPTIKPTQLILHSIVAPWDEQRLFAYWKNSTSLESHFGLDFDGSLGQYLPTTTRADANAQANRRADGTGAVSVESASNTKATDAWTDDQMTELRDLGVWIHRAHGIPLRICRTHDDGGYGYHRLHRHWSTSGTSCPGDKRVVQFRQELFPAIVAKAQAGTTPVPPGPLPVVRLAHIVAAQRRDPGLAEGAATHHAAGLVVEQALYRAGLLGKRWVDGSLGTRTLPAVSEWQERLGYSGRQPGGDADGYFGRDSLTQLGGRYGFKVVD